MSETLSRLDRISTLWSVVCAAQDGTNTSTAQTARERLLFRYGGAVRRYLLAVTRNPNLANELFQEFSVRMLQGRLSGASRDRGRFRLFVKGVLFNLISEHRRKLNRQQAQPLADEIADASRTNVGEHFVSHWREELLHQVWSELQRIESETKTPYYFVLRYRVAQPDVSSATISTAIRARFGIASNDGHVRQLLHRARQKFAEHLLQLVCDSLPNPTRDEIESELIDLQLLKYCEAALKRRG